MKYLLAIALIWVVPLAVIWALNILFALAIPYTLKTWAAAFILIAILSGGASSQFSGE